MRARVWNWIAISTLAVVISLSAMLAGARLTGGFFVWSDGVAYFIYARSLVVDGDLNVTNEYQHLDARLPDDAKVLGSLRRWATQRADGQVRMPWPAGTGVALAPAYALGLAAEVVTARFQGRPPDTYGPIPQAFFALGSVMFAVAGLAGLISLCRLVTDAKQARVAAGAAVLCGPMLFYGLFNPSMAHAVSFALVVALTYFWLRAWLRGTRYLDMVAVGAMLGLAAVVRYQNALFAILPVCLVLFDWRRMGFRRAAVNATVGMIASAVPITLLLVGHLELRSTGSGTVVAASYPVDLTSPFFIDVLFSCRHGAFYWAPLLGVAALWLLFASVRRTGWAMVLFMAVVLQTYLIGGLGLATSGEVAQSRNWLTHWSGAPSFGMRYLAECAPMFALGLAVLLRDTQRHIRLGAVIAIVTALALWNGLLVMAYGLDTITRSDCLPYNEMWSGIVQAIHIIFDF